MYSRCYFSWTGRTFQTSSTISRCISLSNPCGVLEPFMSEAKSLLEASMSSNTWNTYSSGVDSFKRFRTLYNLSPLWPPPVEHFTNFITYMSYSSYSQATIRAYVSGLSFVLKGRDLEDTTQSFIIQNMIKGANKLYGRVDVRCPITMDILLKLPNALQFVSNSMYESTMFTAAFSLSYFGLLRVGEVLFADCQMSVRLYKIQMLHLLRLQGR